MIQAARRRHLSTRSWLMFNVWVALNVALWTPLQHLATIGVAAFWLNVSLPTWLMIVCTPLVFVAFNILHLTAICRIKWLLIGRFREGIYPFYGRFHYKWVMMMTALHSASPFLESLHGTVFSNVFNRAMGARVGVDACLMTDSLESDLLTVGDGASINEDCDITCHTVENMVLKLAPVRIESQATIRTYSVVMPGGTMESGASLLEQSQVLKGETIGANEIWAGLPAEPSQ